MKAIYFSHDTNSFYDPKIRIIVGKYGVWSYSVFWIILEMMATQKDYKIPLEDFAEGIYPLIQSKTIIYDSDNGIGFYKDNNGKEINVEDVGRFSICLATIKDLLNSMIDIGLFQLSEDNFLYSDSLLERMKHRDYISLKRIEAGRLGGLCKSKQLLSSKVKESKVKESKDIKNQYLDFVLLTLKEYQSLKNRLGEKADMWVKKLNDYIGSKGKRYKSHYHTICMWVDKEKNQTTGYKKP